MKRSISSLIRYAALLIWVSCSLVPASADVLSYWNFNNIDAAPQQRVLGSFSAVAAEFGERYDPAEQRLFSNTKNGTVFYNDAIYLDLSDLRAANPMEGDAEIGQHGIWGVFHDTDVAKLESDATAGGSLLLFHRDLNQRTITFHLSSKGYHDLKAHYACRNTPLEAKNFQKWSYSVDGSEFAEIPNAAAFDTDNFREVAFSLPEELNNKESFYLRVTFYLRNASSSSMDNFSLRGKPIKP